MTNPTLIETDAYGRVPRSLYNLGRRNNVSPMDMDELRDEFGHHNFGAISEAIRDRSSDPGWENCYRAPNPHLKGW